MKYRNVFAVVVFGLILTLGIIFSLLDEGPPGPSLVVATLGGIAAGVIAGFRYLATLRHGASFRLKRRMTPWQSTGALVLPAVVFGVSWMINEEFAGQLVALCFFYGLGACVGFACPRIVGSKSSSHA